MAHHVLADVYLFRFITSFQRGFPRDLVDLVKANDTTFRPRGWLPALVVANGDLPMLQRLHRLYEDQATVFAAKSFLTFSTVWLDALEAGQLEMAAWIDAQPLIRSTHDATVTLRFAISSARIDVVEWLLQHRPQYKNETEAAFTSEAIEDCPTVEMFCWLTMHVSPLPKLTALVDRAADRGRLELVQYVMTQYGGSCSSRAIVGAASHGHLDVVTFLHTHVHAQCSSNAMRAAAWYGHLEIVRFLNEHCAEAHGDALELAAMSGHLAIVVYLVRTRTDVRVMRAHALVQQTGQHHDVQAYLAAMLNPVSARYDAHTAKEQHDGDIPKSSSVCSVL